MYYLSLFFKSIVIFAITLVAMFLVDLVFISVAEYLFGESYLKGGSISYFLLQLIMLVFSGLTLKVGYIFLSDLWGW